MIGSPRDDCKAVAIVPRGSATPNQTLSVAASYRSGFRRFIGARTKVCPPDAFAPFPHDDGLKKMPQ